MPELKAVHKMTTAHPDTIWKMTTPLTHSGSNNSVIHFGSPGSDVIFEVIEISDACFIHLLFQYAPL